MAKPLIFGNKVIQQMIKHVVSEDTVIEPRDYLALRDVFRKCNGSWEKLASGDQIHIELLKKIVTEWGKMPNRRKKSDQLV